MFLMVYFHKKSLSYELLFRKWLQDPNCSYKIPSDLNEYKYIDTTICGTICAKALEVAQCIKNSVYKVAGKHGSIENVDLTIPKYRKRQEFLSRVPRHGKSIFQTKGW